MSEEEMELRLEELAHAVDAVVRVEPPGALRARGRKHRVRRTMVLATGATGMAATVGVALALLPGADRNSGDVAGAASSGGRAVTIMTSTTSTDVPTHSPSPKPERVVLDARATTYLLDLMLPAGFTTSRYAGMQFGHADKDSVQTQGGMTVDDGHGAAQITATFGPADFEPAQICATGCTKLPDGSLITERQVPDGTTTNGKGPKPVAWEVNHWLTNGWRVGVGELNYPADYSPLHNQGPQVVTTRTQPPLSMDQLKQIVTDPRWQSTVPASLAEQADKDMTPFHQFATP
jgi:hypothetical protein